MQSNLENTDYLATLCHEIGTPLTTILGLSHILSTTECSPQKKIECASMLRDSSQMLMRLLNDLLDSSKLEAGKMEIEQTSFCLIEMVEGAMQLIAHRAEEKGLEFFYISAAVCQWSWSATPCVFVKF